MATAVSTPMGGKLYFGAKNVFQTHEMITEELPPVAAPLPVMVIVARPGGPTGAVGAGATTSAMA